MKEMIGNKNVKYIAGGVFNCLYDGHFTLLGSQSNLYRFLGYTPEEMEFTFQNHLLECICSDDRQIVKEEITRQLDCGNVFMCENRLITKSGEIRWVWIGAELHTDEAGRRYFHCIFHDITSMKEDQQKLALSEKRYEIVLSQMQDIIFELDCHTFDIYYSPSFLGPQIPIPKY